MSNRLKFWKKAPPVDDDGWYFCIKHQKVEHGKECPAKDRLGPYATRAEAEHALATAQERNREWDADPAWNDPARPGDPPGERRVDGSDPDA